MIICFSNPAWAYEILKAEVLVLTLIPVGLACLQQLSSPVRLDQSTQQHVFQARVFPSTLIPPSSAYLEQ